MKVKRIRHKVARAQRNDKNINELQRHKGTKNRSIKNSVPMCLSASVPNNRGFSLMELMVVIAIIVLLAGIMVPNLANRIERAKITRAEADISSIESAIAMYENDTGRYPESDPSVTPYVSASNVEILAWRLTGRIPIAPYSTDTLITGDRNWHGPYIKGIEQDPWKQDYVYLKNGHPRDPCPGPTCSDQFPGIEYPQPGDGSCLAPATNLSYYIYSTGKDKKTSNSTDGDLEPYENPINTTKDDHDDDINNWDVNKNWRKAK